MAHRGPPPGAPGAAPNAPAAGAPIPQQPPGPRPQPFVPANVDFKFATHLFNDPTKDPHRGNYVHLMEPFVIDPNVAANNMAPATIRDLIAQAGSNFQPLALGLLHNGSMRVYLCPQRMDPGLGERLPAHVSGNMYAFDGDLNYNSGFNVVIPDTLFHQTNYNVLTPSVGEIQNALAADPNATLLGPFNQGDQNVVTRRTRRIIPLPFAYVGLFLATAVTPRHYFDSIYPVIQADGNDAACSALTRYFQVGITRAAANQLSTADIPLADLPVGVNETVVQRRRRLLLEHYFPQMGQNQAHMQSNSIATAIADLDQNMQLARAADEQRRLDQKADDNLEQWLGAEAYGRIMCLCNSASEADLPPIWNQLKNANRRQWVALVDQAYQIEKEAMEQHYLSMGANLSEINTMKSALWHSPHPDAIKSGFQVFLCGPTDEEAHFSYTTEVGLILSGTAGASLDDVRALTRQDVQLPTEIGALDYLLRQECKARVWTGRNSTYSTWLTQTNRSLRIGRSLWDNWTPPPNTSVNKAGKGILLVKWVSNRSSSYFQRQALSPAPLTTLLPAPDFIITKILAEDVWAPNLSPAFIGKYNVREFCRMLTPSPPSAPIHTPPAGGGGGGTTDTGGQPPQGGQPTGTRGSNTRVNNLNYIASMFSEFANRRIANRSVRDMITNGTLPALPPSKVPGANMCLAFHTKGYCNTGCGNSTDHVPYTETELRPLREWCVTNYPAAQSPAAPAGPAAAPGTS